MPRLPIVTLTLGILLTTLFTGCNETAQETKPLTISEGWPKSISDSYGTVTLDRPPKRIVSTSVSITGTLLTIDAPLIASGGTRPNTRVANEDGFFKQWSEVANERKVAPLYQGVANAESVAKQKPDLILVSATGGDSAVKLYKQFSTIAPTIVVNYDDKSWQDLARLLADITDKKAEAERAISKFEIKLSDVKKQIVLPPQPISALVYYGDDRGGNFWTKESAQGQVLSSLGFSLSELPEGLKDNHQLGKRKDIIPVNGEKFADAITGQSVLLFAANDSTVSQMKSNKFISHLTPITQSRVYAMGDDSFRLDYYSSMNLLSTIESTFNQ